MGSPTHGCSSSELKNLRMTEVVERVMRGRPLGITFHWMNKRDLVQNTVPRVDTTRRYSTLHTSFLNDSHYFMILRPLSRLTSNRDVRGGCEREAPEKTRPLFSTSKSITLSSELSTSYRVYNPTLTDGITSDLVYTLQYRSLTTIRKIF